VLLPRQQAKLARGAKDKEHAMSLTPNTAIAVIGYAASNALPLCRAFSYRTGMA
jgi:hypothetical protein